MNLTISVIIPTFNRGSTIARSLKSVVEQTYSPMEVIVIDDGSVDSTREVIELFSPEVQYYYQKNAGVSSARQAGVAIAKGKWIAFLDSDDHWNSGHLEAMVHAVRQTKSIAFWYFSDVAYSPAKVPATYWGSSGFLVSAPHILQPNGGEWAFLETQPALLQASLISRQAILDVGGFSRTLRTREDTLLFFQISLAGPVCAVNNIGTIMTDDATNRLTVVHSTDTLEYRDSTVKLYETIRHSFPGLGYRHQDILRRRQTLAHIGLTTLALRKRNWKTLFWGVLAAMRVSPISFVFGVSRRAIKVMLLNLATSVRYII
jgi:glycosyltransferase involved in cell wall biosynthesis